jgi:hypothetical protein
VQIKIEGGELDVDFGDFTEPSDLKNKELEQINRQFLLHGADVVRDPFRRVAQET